MYESSCGKTIEFIESDEEKIEFEDKGIIIRQNSDELIVWVTNEDGELFGESDSGNLPQADFSIDSEKLLSNLKQ